MNKIAILGATGSIGASALDVIARHPDRFDVSVLSAHRNTVALADLCARFQPELALIADPACTDDLAARLTERGVHCEIGSGTQAIVDASASHLCDTVIAAIVGAAGLLPTLAAAHAGKRLLLANKESVVMAGPLLMQALAAGGGTLIPIDSEHNALFQCLPGGGPPDLAAAGVRRLILTASGGPFRGCTRTQLADVTPDQACAHPKWSMGRKISVDSATLMNKGLEVIEAHILFGAPIDAIDVLVHPQSLVHSLVDYVDGSHLAQLGLPDMRTALSHALAWPERINSGVGLFDLAAEQRLDFEAPDTDTFRCLPLAYAALRAGGDAPTLLNAANEVAVAAFLAGKLPFLAISEVIDATLQAMPAQPINDVETLVKRDLTARDAASRIMARFTCPPPHPRSNTT